MINEAGRRRQEAIVDFLRAFAAEHSYSPSILEITAGCGLSSTSVVHSHLLALQKAGVVHYLPRKARTLRLLNTAVQERANG